MTLDRPLEPGEHVDLDSGPLTSVSRDQTDDLFVLRDHTGSFVYASASNIRTAAELAGVIDSEIP